MVEEFAAMCSGMAFGLAWKVPANCRGLWFRYICGRMNIFEPTEDTDSYRTEWSHVGDEANCYWISV